MFLLVDFILWDFIVTGGWDECCEDVCDDHSDNEMLEHVLVNINECVSAGDSCSKSKPLSVQGRLRECSAFWKTELDATQFTLDIVTLWL